MTSYGVGGKGMVGAKQYGQPVDGYASMNNKRATEFKKSA